VDMAVVTEKGLVGRVIEVGGHWAKVLSIIDSQSAVSAIAQRSRDNGTLQGDTTLYDGEGLCRMVYLPQDATVREGDIVITSGLGDIFPKGLPIGTVVGVENEPFAVYQTARIQPGVDFEHLEEVLVIGDTIPLPEQIE
jgi:rod shape-determining protein MreC